jgi:hypothetical protein
VDDPVKRFVVVAYDLKACGLGEYGRKPPRLLRKRTVGERLCPLAVEYAYGVYLSHDIPFLVIVAIRNLSYMRVISNVGATLCIIFLLYLSCLFPAKDCLLFLSFLRLYVTVLRQPQDIILFLPENKS